MRVNQIRSIIIIDNMKQSRISEHHKNHNPKFQKSAEDQSIIEDLKHFNKNNKNGQFTGSSLDRIQRQYYPQSQRSSQTSCSIVINKNQKKLQHEEDQTKASKDKSNNSSIFSTKAELENQIERLNSELEIKDQKLKDINQHQQSRKSEIIQLHKTINFYKGKLDLMEAQLRSYEDCLQKLAQQCDEKSKFKSQVEELVALFQGMRTQNSNLNGKYQQKSYQLRKLTQKYIKLKQKLNNASILKGTQSRSTSSKNQKNFDKSNSLSKRFYQPNMNEKTRKNYIWTLQAKIQSIQSSMIEINKQNEKLLKQLQQKQRIIIDLTNKIQIKFNNENKLQQNILNPYNSENKLSRKKEGEIKISKNDRQVSNNTEQSQNNYISTRISLIIRKLRYHMIGEQLNYENFLQLLADEETNASTLIQLPFRLNEQQASELMLYIYKMKQNISTNYHPQQRKQKLMKAMRDKIGYYKNMSIRKQQNVKMQVFKEYLNRSSQIADKIKQVDTMIYSLAQQYFADWGLRQEEIDLIFKCYYEQTRQVERMSLSMMQDIILRWKSI